MVRAFLRELGPSILEAMFTTGDKQLFNYGCIEKIIRDKPILTHFQYATDLQKKLNNIREQQSEDF